MSETQVQAGIVTKLEDEGSECGSRRQAMVLQVTDSIPMGPAQEERTPFYTEASKELRCLPQISGSRPQNSSNRH
jgi:hypothetical protein